MHRVKSCADFTDAGRSSDHQRRPVSVTESLTAARTECPPRFTPYRVGSPHRSGRPIHHGLSATLPPPTYGSPVRASIRRERQTSEGRCLLLLLLLCVGADEARAKSPSQEVPHRATIHRRNQLRCPPMPFSAAADRCEHQFCLNPWDRVSQGSRCFGDCVSTCEHPEIPTEVEALDGVGDGEPP